MGSVILGLDLGMKRDYTALAAVEKWTEDLGRDLITYEMERVERVGVRAMARMRLGMGYLAVPDWVRARIGEWGLRGAKGVTLVVDATGVGAPVVEMLRKAELGCTVAAVTITAGGVAGWGDGGWTVSRRELLTRLGVGMESGRVVIAAGVGEREALKEELLGLRRDKAAGHDDLAMALAMAWWWGEKAGKSVAGTRSLGLEY